MKWTQDTIRRERGILTEHDRRYLLQELDEELSPNAEYQKRYQIRQRIQNAIIDFQIISHELSGKDLDHLFESVDKWAREARRSREKNREYPPAPKMSQNWSALWQFFIYNHIASRIPDSERLAEWVIEEGIARALRQYGFKFYREFFDTEVTVSWSVKDRYPLMDYINYVEQEMLTAEQGSEEYLLGLYQNYYLPYSMIVYLYSKHNLGGEN